MKLLEILGKNPISPEGAEVLVDYPRLVPDVEEFGPGEGEPVRYLRSEADGLLIKLSAEGDVQTIFLMSEGKDGFAQFGGELPGGLNFQSTRADTLKALGAPAYIRAPGKIGQFQVGELMRFDRPAHSIHVQFRADRSGIELVTMVVASAVPGRARGG